MELKKRSNKVSYFGFVILFQIGITGCNFHENTPHIKTSIETKNQTITNDSSNLIPLESHSSDYFPCSDCHLDRIPNAQRREMVEMHDDIIFDHDSENRWCLSCHDVDTRDSLRLASGKLLGFNESYKLCGQCHGPKLRDWKLGIHGKRTGEWNGKKQYFLCVHCHDPHSPKFKALTPMPPPLKPEQINIDSIN